MTRKTLLQYKLILMLLIITPHAFSQVAVLKGQVINEKAAPIANASVTLLNNDNRTLNYGFTDNQGGFLITQTVSDSIKLVISSIGYERRIFTFSINSDTTLVINTVLKEEIIQLDQVIINAKKPKVIKDDTITYDAEAYLTGNEKVVEDLLKNLPGVTVSETGTIKVYGKEVSSVMVDGDDFFENGYKILTQSMPSSPISQVEILNRYSKNKLLKGIENSDEIALNLKLNEDAKRIWFGNANLGYSIDGSERHQLEGNVMNFGSRNKFVLLSKFNNIGLDPIEDLGYLIDVQQEISGTSDIEKAQQIVELGTNFLSFKQERYLFNNNKLIAPNAIFNLSKKIKLKTLWAFNTDQTDFQRINNEVFTLTDGNFTNQESLAVENDKEAHFVQLKLTYDISDNKSLDISNKFIANTTQGNSALLFNGLPTNEDLNSSQSQFNSVSTFTHKLTDKKALILQGVVNYDQKNQDYAIDRFYFSEAFNQVNGDDSLLQQTSNEVILATIKSQLLSRTSENNLWDIQLGNTLINRNLGNTLQATKNTEPSTQLLTDNAFSYLTNATYIKTSASHIFDKLKLTTHLDLESIYNAVKSDDISSSQNTLLVIPYVGGEWKINNSNKFNVTYGYNQKIPALLQVQPNRLITSFRTLRSGFNDIEFLSQSNYSLDYEHGEWGDDFFLKSTIQLADFDKYISTENVIFQNYSTASNILLKNGSFLSGYGFADQYINTINSSIKLTLQGSKYNYDDIVNDQPRSIESVNYSTALALRSGFKGLFNFNIGSELRRNEFNVESSNSVDTQLSFIDLYFNLTSKLSAVINAEQYITSGTSQRQQTFYFFDLTASYKIKGQLSMTLSGVNLFDQNQFTDYSAADFSLLSSEYELLPRYVMLKIEFRF